MRRVNLLAASAIAAMFVVLSLVPLTRTALRFDMQLAAGKPILGRMLVDLGLKQEDMPFGGMGPAISTTPDTRAADSPELPVRLANAMQLSGRVKWGALQKLVAEFPENLAVHAALARIACKNGGSVGVGHDAEQYELLASPPPSSPTKSSANPDDARVMLRSCESGERLAPDNAYFPAMAAIAHFSLNNDTEARAALHRAAQKPRWQEYLDVEAAGRVRRAELLFGPQNTLTKTVVYASILFPHYAALRGMARVVTAQAMHAEQSGDFKTGLALRHDTAQLGAKMREQSSSLIGSLVGTAMIRVAEGRPGGAPALKADEESKSKETETRFLAYLAANGQAAEAAWWQKQLAASDESRAIAKRTDASVLGGTAFFATPWKLLANLALLSVASLLCILGGLAFLQPWLGRKTQHLAPVIAVAAFMVILSGAAWQSLGNCRDFMALSGLIQGLSGSESVDTTWSVIKQTIQGEISLIVLVLLTPFVYLATVAFQTLKKRGSLTARIRQTALPLAAVLTLAYAVHLTAFALRERVIERQLRQVLTHEGRFIAAQIGKEWPTVP